jgi:hypothetical protein
MRFFNADFSGRLDGGGGTAVPPPLFSIALIEEETVPTPATTCQRCSTVSLNVKAGSETEEGTDEAEFVSGAGDAGGCGDDDEDSGDECVTN